MDMDEELQIKIGERIRALRKQKGFTQVDLSAKMGKDYQWLQRVERGVQNVTIQSLKQLANGLDVELIDIFRFDKNNS